MVAILLTLTAFGLGHDRLARCEIHRRVDLVELNSVYDEDGKLVFDQFILWDYDVDDQLRVRSYYLPKRDHLCYWDGQRLVRYWDGKLYVIEAATQRRSWTQYDPEILDRQHLHPENRRRVWP